MNRGSSSLVTETPSSNGGLALPCSALPPRGHGPRCWGRDCASKRRSRLIGASETLEPAFWSLGSVACQGTSGSNCQSLATIPQVLDIRCTPAGRNEFGQIHDGLLRMEGPCQENNSAAAGRPSRSHHPGADRVHRVGRGSAAARVSTAGLCAASSWRARCRSYPYFVLHAV